MSDAAKLQEKLQKAVSQGKVQANIDLNADQKTTDLKSAEIKPIKTVTGMPTSVSADLMQPPSSSARIMSLSIVVTVLGAIAWSSHAVVQEVTIGQGRVVPAGKVQIVQNLEGGIIRQITIKPGAVVHKGQLLLKIDPTGFDSKLKERREQIAGLSARITRYHSQLNNTPLKFDLAFAKKYPKLVSQNNKLYRSRLAEITSALAAIDDKSAQKQQEITETKARQVSLEKALAISNKELEIISRLARDNVVSKSELLASQAKVNDLEGQIEAMVLALPRLNSGLKELANMKREKLSNFRSDILAKLNEAQIKISSLKKSIEGDADRVKRTQVKSPVDGIVKALHTNTIGQVVKPGADLVEIVPQNDSLLIETRIQPKDIAFLHLGQKAVVKLTAYDYALYGSLEGKLERIGADSITDKKGNTYYLVDVRTNKTYLKRKSEKLPIISGMVARVDIITGKKTIFRYMTKPLHRMATEALHER